MTNAVSEEAIQAVLAVLERAGERGLHAATVADVLNALPQTVVVAMQELERRGLATYVAHPGIEIRMRSLPGATIVGESEASR